MAQAPNIGIIYDYDPKTNTWATITDPEDVWLASLIHTLKSEPKEMLRFSNYGLSNFQDYNDIAPEYELYRTTKQFRFGFKELLIKRTSDTPLACRVDAQLFSGNKPKTAMVELNKYRPIVTEQETETMELNTPKPDRQL